MLRIPRTTLTIILIAVVAITLVGAMVGAFVAFIPAPSGNGPQGANNGKSNPQATSQPATTPQPTLAPANTRSATVNGVSLTLVDFQKSTDPKGIQITVDLANQTNGNLSFPFYPARDLSLSDNVGSNYNFSWAAYAGEVTVESGKRAQLVRAFFNGPDRDATPDHYTVILVGVPQVTKAVWDIDWPAAATKPNSIAAATPAPTQAPDKSTNGVGGMITQNKVSLTLTSAEPNDELGGVLITMAILNNSAGDLSFLFSPEKNITIVDNRGSNFNLRWAEYAGSMKVGKGQQVQLVKAFYEGPVTDAATSKVTISVANIPEFGGAAWQVSLK